MIIKKTLQYGILIMVAFTGFGEVKSPALWKEQFGNTLPMLGHRNWILIVDKAFPHQQAEGMQYIDTKEKLLPVLKHVIGEINSSNHVKPIIYRDQELGFISEKESAGVMTFAEQSSNVLNGQPVSTLPHDSIFSKLDQVARLFNVVVLKTDETIPYSSVFIQLDCDYWDAGREGELRKKLKQEAGN